jgi:hypothetical protein
MIEFVSASEKEIARDYDEENVQEVVRTIRKFKREKRGGSMFPYMSSDDPNEAKIKLGKPGAMLEKRDFEEARHLAAMRLEFIRESKCCPASTLKCQLHVYLIESTPESDNMENWKITCDLVLSVLSNNENNLAMRIIKLRIMTGEVAVSCQVVLKRRLKVSVWSGIECS